MRSIYIHLLLLGHIAHASESKFALVKQIYENDIHAIENVIASKELTMENLQKLQNIIDAKNKKCTQFMAKKYDAIASIDTDIAALQRIDTDCRNNVEWANWYKHRGKLIESETTKSDYVKPFEGFNPSDYWSQIVDASSVIFYKTYKYSVEALEERRAQATMMMHDKIAKKEFLKKEIDQFAVYQAELTKQAIKAMMLNVGFTHISAQQAQKKDEQLVASARNRHAACMQQINSEIKNREEQKQIASQKAFRLQIIAEQKMLQDEKLKTKEAKKQAQRAQSQAENAAKKEAEFKKKAFQEKVDCNKKVAQQATYNRKIEEQKKREIAKKNNNDAIISVSTKTHEQIVLPELSAEVQDLISYRFFYVIFGEQADPRFLHKALDWYDISHDLFQKSDKERIQHVLFLIEKTFDRGLDTNLIALNDMYKKIEELDQDLRNSSSDVSKKPLSTYISKELHDKIASRYTVLENLCKNSERPHELTKQILQVRYEKCKLNVVAALTISVVMVYNFFTMNNNHTIDYCNAIRTVSHKLEADEQLIKNKANKFMCIYQMKKLLHMLSDSHETVA